MPEIDYGEEVKKKIAKELVPFLLLKNKKPERVTVTVQYHESTAKLNIDIDDITPKEPSK